MDKNKNIAGIRRDSSIGKLFMEVLAKHAAEGCSCGACGENIEPIKVTVGEKQLEGQLAIAITLSNEGKNFKMGQAIEGNHITPLEVVAMLEALDNVQDVLKEQLVGMTINELFGVRMPEDGSEDKV